MKCPNCGKELPEGTKFCIYCGTKLIVEQPIEVVEEPVVQKEEPKIEPKVERVEKNTTVKVEKYSEAEKKTFKKRRWGCGLIVLIFLAIGVFSKKDDSKTPSSEPSYVETEVPNEDTNTSVNSQIDESSSDEGEEMSAEELERLIIETEESYEGDTGDNSLATPIGLSGSFNFTGLIDDKYPITMYFEITGEEEDINGYYYYDKNGPDARLTLIGSCSGGFYIDEFNNEDRHTGRFQVTSYEENLKEIRGIFNVRASDKDLPFVLTRND